MSCKEVLPKTPFTIGTDLLSALDWDIIISLYSLTAYHWVQNVTIWLITFPAQILHNEINSIRGVKKIMTKYVTQSKTWIIEMVLAPPFPMMTWVCSPGHKRLNLSKAKLVINLVSSNSLFLKTEVTLWPNEKVQGWLSGRKVKGSRNGLWRGTFVKNSPFSEQESGEKTDSPPHPATHLLPYQWEDHKGRNEKTHGMG